jgi:predicted nucleic acid-binding protein
MPREPHRTVFVQPCRDGGARGNLVPDAYLAALAIDTGSELATADRGFARFPGPGRRHPPS